MVLYGITLVSLEEYLRGADTTLLPPFYADDAVFGGLAMRITAQLKLLMAWGMDWGYFPELEKSLFISGNPEEEEAERRNS